MHQSPGCSYYLRSISICLHEKSDSNFLLHSTTSPVASEGIRRDVRGEASETKGFVRDFSAIHS